MNSLSRSGKNKHTKRINHTQADYGIRQEAKDFPMMCVLSFVYICNARCPNCPYTNSNIRVSYQDQPFMSEKTFKIIADQCGQYGAWLRISGGGEPMLHPQSVELLEYAKSVNARVGLITNGSLFTEENSIRLLRAGIDMIEFSVDAGDAQSYSRVRQGLDWGNLVNNVKRMYKLRNKLGSPTKIIASVVNQVGIDVEAAVRFWSPIVDNIQKRKYLTWGINNPSNSADPAPYLPPEQHIPCPFIFERLNIDSKGKVMVCGYDISANTDMGNVHTQSIKDIWHGEKFEYFRKMHLSRRGLEINLCKDCPDWKYRSWTYNYWKIVNDVQGNKEIKSNSSASASLEGHVSDNK
jgi:radical SAM protein with 4Fe4S-binding SPASM domain